jgi:arginase family enzyme
MPTQRNRKIFGVALDASDDPLTIQLKLASVHAEKEGMEGLYADPYDLIMNEFPWHDERIEFIGKLPIPSWLTPRPRLSDLHMVTKNNMETYVANGGVGDLAKQVRQFVKEKVFPGLPVMLGVDHSATGGVISALSEEVGPENLSVLVLDQHFDGLPLALRLEPRLIEKLGYSPEGTCRIPDILEDEAYCCGNFWKHLLDKGAVFPENLLFVGVADYPGKETPPEWDRFRENYLNFEARGCLFFPLKEFNGKYLNRLRQFMAEMIKTPNFYVSLDLDVGAYQCVHAARYMDRMGVDKEALMDVVQIINDLRDSENIRLAGLDVMEFNMHFLGLEIEPGEKDKTVSVALEFMKKLLFH